VDLVTIARCYVEGIFVVVVVVVVVGVSQSSQHQFIPYFQSDWFDFILFRFEWNIIDVVVVVAVAFSGDDIVYICDGGGGGAGVYGTTGVVFVSGSFESVYSNITGDCVVWCVVVKQHPHPHPHPHPHSIHRTGVGPVTTLLNISKTLLHYWYGKHPAPGKGKHTAQASSCHSSP